MKDSIERALYLDACVKLELMVSLNVHLAKLFSVHLAKVAASPHGAGQLAQCHQEAGRECPCARLLSIVRQVVVSSNSEQLPVVHPSHLL